VGTYREIELETPFPLSLARYLDVADVPRETARERRRTVGKGRGKRQERRESNLGRHTGIPRGRGTRKRVGGEGTRRRRGQAAARTHRQTNWDDDDNDNAG